MADQNSIASTALCKLHDIGLHPVSIAMDGVKSNLSMLKKFGASLDPYNLNPIFPHPSDASKTVGGMLDAEGEAFITDDAT